MDLRLKSNEDESNYDKWTSTYVSGLFKEIIQYSSINLT
ncbi:MAG: hypothetical protein K0R54_4951 [Clostridiaceae bacterium]|nr:hypothetical protein [Clostridiaceae bacterium]